MNVREATSDDLPALRAIQETTLAEPWPELLSLGVDGQPIVLVAADPRPVGYALAVVGEDGAGTDVGEATGVDDVEVSAVGYLVELAVAPAAQGLGHGSALLERLVERFREAGVDLLRVTVRTVDERARSFYRDRGFEREARLSDHYESGDGVLLVRDIGQ